VIDAVRQLVRLLTPRQRQRAISQAVLVLVGAAFEAASIAMIAPVMGIVTSGASGRSGGIAGMLPRSMIEAFPMVQRHALPVALVVLVAFYLLKTAVLLFVIWRQAAFATDVAATVSCRLAEHFLGQSYPYHTARNSADLISTAITEATVFGHGVSAVVTVATEIVMCLGIGALLFSLEPLAATTAIVVFGAATFVFQRLLNARLRAWGLARQAAERGRMKSLQESLQAIKPIKVAGCEAFFLDRYQTATRQAAAIVQRQSAMGNVPRLWYELVAVLAIAVLTATLVWSGVSRDRVVPILALFAAAAFRLLPSASRLMTGLQTIRHAAPATAAIVEVLEENLPPCPPIDGSAAAGFERLEVRAVTVRYPGKETPALRKLSASIRPGTTVGIIGESGAGKSTFTDLLLGLLEPAEGAVLIDNSPILAERRSWQRRIGYVPQSIYLLDDTIAANIAFGVERGRVDRERVRQVISIARLVDFVAAQPEGVNARVGEHGVRMSGGQRQRIGIARALYHDPDILILDEATSALDVKTEREVMAAIDAMHGEKTIIIVAHRFSTIEQCDVVYRIENGEIVGSGNPAEVLASLRE